MRSATFEELSRTSRGSLESDSDSKESWDVRLNSFKSGILRFFDSIDSIFISIRSILRPSVVDRPDNIIMCRRLYKAAVVARIGGEFTSPRSLRL